MRPPPRLTDRELDIVPFLVTGASRAEIAQHFKLSEETIKMHTKNIFRKFDCANLRDGFQDISEFSDYFIRQNLGYYVHSDLHELYIEPGYHTAKFCRTVVIEKFGNPTGGFRISFGSNIGSISNYQSNIAIKNCDNSIMYFQTFETQNLFKAGQNLATFTYSLDVIDALSSDRESWSGTVRYPTQEFAMKISFPSEKKPTQVTPHQFPVVGELPNSVFTYDDTSGLAILRVLSPNVGVNAGITWNLGNGPERRD